MLRSLWVYKDYEVVISFFKPEDKIWVKSADLVNIGVIVRNINFIQAFVKLAKKPPIKLLKFIVYLIEVFIQVIYKFYLALDFYDMFNVIYFFIIR